MAKRADIAVSTIHDPDIIVFDEPFTGIDPPQRKVIWESIERMADEDKVIIITSHLLRTLSERCNRYGLLYSGKFYDTDRIEEIMQNQGYRDVNSFLEAAFQL
jgi:ABC-type multidrug transport system ATPase subunit